MAAVRLLAIVEGETEESFVNEVLAPYLSQHGYDSISARILGNARLRSRRGGIKPWPGVKRELVRHLREDEEAIVTTMVDYYGLPRTGDGSWPGAPDAIEAHMAAEIEATIGVDFRRHRFVPYIVMHEFEGLLFSDCGAFARGIASANASLVEARLAEIRRSFSTPEDINDSPHSHPSARVEEIARGYQKPLQGVLAALEIGLERIAAECPRFAGWIRQLEASAVTQRAGT